MQIFSDMTFSGTPEALERLLRSLDDSSKLGEWVRDSAAENDIEPLLSQGEAIRAYRNSPMARSPHAVLWLGISDAKWDVTNIVPLTQGSIAPEEYTQLLLSFRSGIAAHLQAAGVKVTEPITDVGPEHFLTENASRLLHAFSVMANKSTGASHPRDRQRWNDFVVAVHRAGCDLAASDLQQLLVENQGWSDEKATELSILFEYEISLLNAYDESR